MKKALALVLALVLALSMAVSAFALELKDLTDLTPEEPGKKVITVVDADDKTVLYTDEAGTYYVALTDEAWYDVKVTANGCVDAKLIEFDPDTMVIVGNLNPVWSITEKGVILEGEDYNGLGYEAALALAAELNKASEVTYYDIVLTTNVNVIEITIANNYGVHYELGSIVIEAKKVVAGVEKNFGGEIEVVNDVTNFEYEQVKWNADNFAKGEALVVDETGYSDYFAEKFGYDFEDEEYNEWENRLDLEAAVVSTTAFRAIEGKDLRICYVPFYAYGEDDYDLTVVLKDIVKGQKGVNFKADAYPVWEDDGDGLWELGEDLTSIEVEFLGNQIVKGEFEITIDLNCDWFELREYFGLKVEEDDIISYYLVDENGKVVGGKEIDYMTADLSKDAIFTVSGSNDTLGSYSLVLEVPSSEVEGESNPNTGAESVVGVVAALAVVSVATAAAVSLKK